MPAKAPKKGPQTSKKADKQKKEKQLEDKTFGLKNKNKSKKVQAHVQSVSKSVLNSGDPRQRRLDEQRKAQKSAAKARKAAQKVEQNNLLAAGLLAVNKNKTAASKSNVEAKGRDAAEDESKSKGTSRAMKMMFQMDAKEAIDKLKEDPFYVPTLEDELEEKRQLKLEELAKNGQKGTPITEETFKKWLDNKKQKRALEAKKAVEAEFKKKKGGKGLSILSGRDLYLYNQKLFKDDDLDNEMDLDNGNDNDNGVVNNTDSIDHTDTTTTATDVLQLNEKLDENLFLHDNDDDLDDLDDIDDEE